MLNEITMASLSGGGWVLTNPGGNYTTNGYPTRANSISSPAGVTAGVTSAGDGVIPLGHGGSICPQWLVLQPLGVGNAATTFTMQVILWRPTKLFVAQSLPLWVLSGPLAEWTCTLGNSVGVAGSDLGATTRFCSTIAMTGGPSLITNAAAPTNLTAAPIVEKWINISGGVVSGGLIVVPTFGFKYAEVIYSTGGSATSCNALWTVL